MSDAASPESNDRFDPYLALGVDRGDDISTILAAYRAEARRHHPDVSTEAASQRRMAELNAAWAILRDPLRRAAWDRAHLLEDGPSIILARPHVTTAHADAGSDACVWGRGPNGEGAAGPPPGRAFGSVIAFGLYKCWSIGEIARTDPAYLQWLAERPEGRPFRAEIDNVLAPYLGHARQAATDARPPHRPSR